MVKHSRQQTKGKPKLPIAFLADNKKSELTHKVRKEVLGYSLPAKIRNNVDFPAPFEPSNAMFRPSGKEKHISLKTY